MLILSLTTDKISVITDVGSSDIDTTAAFTDRDQTSGVVGLTNRQSQNITTATTTDVVAAPGATTTRMVQTLFIRNVHATTVTTVTVQYNANGTLYELYKATLYPGDNLMYGDEEGFKIVSGTYPLVDELQLCHPIRASTMSSSGTLSGSFLSIFPRVREKFREGQTYNAVGVAFYRANAVTTGLVCAIDIGDSSITGYVQAMLVVVTNSPTACALGTSVGGTFSGATGSTGTAMVLLAGFIVLNTPTVRDQFNPVFTSEIAVEQGITIDAGGWFNIWQPTG